MNVADKSRHVSGTDAEDNEVIIPVDGGWSSYFVPATSDSQNKQFSSLQIQDDDSSAMSMSSGNEGRENIKNNAKVSAKEKKKWRELTKYSNFKSSSENTTETTTIGNSSSGLEDGAKVDKATDTKTLIEQQRQSYVRRLQREIRWLEKVEKLLMKNQNEPKTTKNGEREKITSSYEDGECGFHRLFNRTRNGHRGKVCDCNCHRKKAKNEIERDRCFVTVCTSSPKKTKTPEKKNIKNERNLKRIPSEKTAVKSNLDSFNSDVPIIRRPIRRALNPGIAWYVPMGETKPWLQTRDPGDGSHATGDQVTNDDDDDDDEDGYRNVLRTSDKLSLQEAARYFKSTTILKSQARQQQVGDAARRRKHKTQLNYIFLNGQREHRITIPKPETENLHKPKKRLFTHREMRDQTEKTYRKLPEVIGRVDCRKKKEIDKTNRLRSQIFKRKIQEGTLQGKLTYSLTEQVQRGLWDLHLF